MRKPQDNLKPEGVYHVIFFGIFFIERLIQVLYFLGDFYQKPKEQLVNGERAKPIRQTDNLHPEGQFYDRPQQAAPLKGDRADIRKPSDNLKPEGKINA